MLVRRDGQYVSDKGLQTSFLGQTAHSPSQTKCSLRGRFKFNFRCLGLV